MAARVSAAVSGRSAIARSVAVAARRKATGEGVNIWLAPVEAVS
jgi:hypothetical protein